MFMYDIPFDTVLELMIIRRKFMISKLTSSLSHLLCVVIEDHEGEI